MSWALGCAFLTSALWAPLHGVDIEVFYVIVLVGAYAWDTEV